MKITIAEQGYTDNSISQKFLATFRTGLLGIFRSKNGQQAESGDLEARKVFEQGNRNPSLNDNANAIDQLAKFRAGFY